MKPYLKRLAVLYHKTQAGQDLTESETRDWCDSLNANLTCKKKHYAYEYTLAYLWERYKSVGRLCPVERMLWRKAMQQNLSLCCELSWLEHLSFIVYQTGDTDYQHEICAKIDWLNGDGVVH